MEYEDFLAKYKNGLLSVKVNGSLALRIMNSDLLPKQYRYAHIFWSWIWILSIPLSIALMIWVKWWIGLLVLFFVTPIISKSTKRSGCQFMIEQAIDNPEFYKYATENGVLIVEEKS